MTGYYQHHPDQPNIMPPDAGWYDTGDVVTLDDDRMICIIGRCKRFAKIGGEMVSLTAVEGLCQQGYPDAEHAILQVPDAKKGEALVWVTTDASSTLKALKEYYQQRNIPMLSLPKYHLIESTLPKMPTGKLDYPALAQHIQEKIALNRE